MKDVLEKVTVPRNVYGTTVAVEIGFQEGRVGHNEVLGVVCQVQ